MAGFDIEGLLDFNMSLHWYMKCFCLLPKPYTQCFFDGRTAFKCPVCDVKYIPTPEYRHIDFGKFLEKKVGRPLKSAPILLTILKTLL